MAPSQTLKWIESGRLPSEQNVEIEGTEPYIVGGHTGSGYWVDTRRRTTLLNLYAAGDVSGGAPKKFVTGALAEGAIAAETILNDMKNIHPVEDAIVRAKAEKIFLDYERRLSDALSEPYDVFAIEEAMQKVMDEYAGGIKTAYRYNTGQLALADRHIDRLTGLAEALTGPDMDTLVHIYELRERLTVCKVLIAHLRARKETRWPGFAVYTDHPEQSGKYECYVNSKWRGGHLEVFTRALVREGEYEHTH